MIWRGIFRQFTLARINGDRSLSAAGAEASAGRVLSIKAAFLPVYSVGLVYSSLYPARK
jgi:hypothetical protein